MPFHCDVCGSTLKGNYDKCPVCAKIDEAAKELLGEDANATMLTDHETSEISIAAVKDAEAQEKGSRAMSVTEILDLAGIMRAAKQGGSEEKPADAPKVFTRSQIEPKKKEPVPEIKKPEPEPAAAIEEPSQEDVLEDIFNTAEQEAVKPEPEAVPVEIPAEEPKEELPKVEEPQPEAAAEEPAVAEEPKEADEAVFGETNSSDKRSGETGLIEKQLIDQSIGLKNRRSSTASFIWTLLLILAVVALGICTALFIVKPLIEKKTGETAEASYVQELAGTWLSKTFTFADDQTEPYAELLQINENGTFAMSYVVVDPEKPDGWSDGSWKTTYHISGTVRVSAQEQRLILLYEEDGNSYFYDRYMISLSDEEMGLREYYDEERTSYYDVTFEKVRGSEPVSAAN